MAAMAERTLLLKGGRVIDPGADLDETIDLLLADGRVARSHRTIERIVRAMLALVEEEGRHRPTADQVASRAGVSRRALYLHFDSLDEVLARAVQWRTSEVLSTWEPPPAAQAPLARIDWYAQSWSELLETFRPLFTAAAVP
jgi:TetR/AcrR family transcriptional regulator, regulator of autoinduction and epiphytic fitness